MEKQITIAIAEDHELLRAGLIALLERYEGISIVADVADGQELLDRLKKQPADVVLLDIEMPVMRGDEALKRIKKEHPAVKVIMISTYFIEALIVKYIKMGANSFLPKTCNIEELVLAIFTVHSKGCYYNTAVSEALVGGLKQKTEVNSNSRIEEFNLSEKEQQIFNLLLKNKSNREIAEELSISTRTVEWHRSHIFQKTGSKNLVSLIKWASQSNPAINL